MAKLTFLGAAGTVTGSKYLVEAAGKRLLVDCGIFQGSQELSERNYKTLPVDPKTIDYLVLTHAHLDHTGWLPVLVKDALHPKPDKHDHHKTHEPLYVTDDVEPVLKLLKPVPRTGSFDISPEFHFTAFDAG